MTQVLPDSGSSKPRMNNYERIGAFLLVFVGIYVIFLTFSIFYYNLADPDALPEVVGVIEKHVKDGLYARVSNTSVYTKILKWPDFGTGIYPITSIMSFYPNFERSRINVKDIKVGKKLLISEHENAHYVNKLCSNIKGVYECKEITTSRIYYFSDVCMTWTFNFIISIRSLIVFVMVCACVLVVCVLALVLIVWSIGACITGDPDWSCHSRQNNADVSV